MTVSRPDRRRLAAALIAVVAVCASTGCRTPGAPPIGPAVDSNVHFSTRVPDVADHAAANLATAALISDRETAARMLRRLEAIDTVLVTGGEPPTGLVPAARDLFNATVDEPRAYREVTRALLESDDLDPALRERLSQAEQDDPLALADERIRDARVIEVARVFNAVAEPIGQSILTFTMAPYRLAKSVLSYLVSLNQRDPLPLQRRQALAHWKEFVERYPDSPEALQLQPRIEHADAKLNETLYERALQAAEASHEIGQTRLSLVYADRALHFKPEDSTASRIREEAEADLAQQWENRQRSLEAPDRLAPATSRARTLAVAMLAEGDVESAAEALIAADPLGPLADEALFAQSIALAENGRELQRWEVLEGIARDEGTNMARHAAALIVDPASNPYEAFAAARSAARKKKALWVFVGRWAGGLPDRGLPAPVEWLIDLPTIAQSLASTPIRLVQLPWAGLFPAARVAAVYGRRYLDLHPDGERAQEVRDWLSGYEEKRDNWIGVYHLALESGETEEKKLAELRESAADQAVEFATSERRRDLRNALYRRIAQEYPDTESGRRAGQLARDEVLEGTPQRIRVTRGFIVENPDFAGPDGLGLDPSLTDDNAANGELHPSGVSLIGGRTLELNYVAESGDEDDPPTQRRQEVSEARFARLVAKLEEVAFKNSLLDSDDPLIPDANRDVFFERARVGLADEVDTRPLAESSFTYTGMRERYGVVRSRESILPFDLVIQGDLSELSLGAFPRLRKPRQTQDAFLYR